MKINITGASGFIGKHLVSELSIEHKGIVPISRSYHAGYAVVENYFDTPPGDLLVHLAEDPDRNRVNQLGQGYIQFSSAVIKNLVEKFGKNLIYISSGIVYGDAGHIPYEVESNLYSKDIYTQSKILNESICLEAGGTVLRLSNIYGEGMSKNNVFSHIIDQVKSKDRISLQDPVPIRDFLYVKDVCQILDMVIKNRKSGVFNVGSGIGVSILELARKISRISGENKYDINFNFRDQDRWSFNVLDIKETSKSFGWIPKYTLDDGIQNLLLLYK
ncbi:NAD(P)-dependent oxidoreductase [Polynucleobacter sp. UB-Siik-W21]|uniref:NAD-dependent epimerase/dehydratase family protein n=1 Tax=Polynucleobacter sp. UB-Siik-W21 TaxID=1855646 RepID=UPI001BFE36CF|nr:NAD(P)-dependent oxidoreductase [Polynucleobacter sp. UB-Siik-W21]QWD70713.1 NAD(P)-dependent oxidoreductase [Polynucleobacter sp. UB-Siik-W21]